MAKVSQEKMQSWDFYTKVLGSPKYIVAPMVDQSELAWRMLCRQHGAQLCYSPMFHSNLFANDPKYRKDALQTCEDDRPLIIQFCGNDPKTMLDAAILAQDYCDAIDINLGCPQAIAKRGHYGAFLQDEWNLLEDIVKTLSTNLSVAVTCKIRVFDDKEKTIKYARMLESSGCKLLTVHGRTRDQKGPLTGVADWSYIKAVRENVKVPMFANGNILCLEDVHRCLEETNVQGVMSAEGNLHNPAIFEGINPVTWDMANEYLDYVDKYPCPISYIRGHLFKLFHHLFNLKSNAEIREKLAVANEPDKFRDVVNSLKEKYEPYHNGTKIYTVEDSSIQLQEDSNSFNLSLPPWICKPYIRPKPEDHKKIIEEKVRIAEDPETVKEKFFDNDGNEISRKKMKKMRRKSRRPLKPEGYHERCLEPCRFCDNPKGVKCEYKLCRTCCRDKCFLENGDCPGHKFLFKTRRERAKLYDSQRKFSKELKHSAIEVDCTGDKLTEDNSNEIESMDDIS